MLDKLSGFKTYIAYVLLMAWVAIFLKVPGAKDAIGAENFAGGVIALLAAAGISQRAATSKTADRVEDLHDKVTPPSGPSVGLVLMLLLPLALLGAGCSAEQLAKDEAVAHAALVKLESGIDWASAHPETVSALLDDAAEASDDPGFQKAIAKAKAHVAKGDLAKAKRAVSLGAALTDPNPPAPVAPAPTPGSSSGIILVPDGSGGGTFVPVPGSSSAR